MSTQITTANNTKPFLKTEKLMGQDFYYTIRGRQSAGDDYYSPQEEAIAHKQNKHEVVLCQEKQLKSGKCGKSYGCIDITKLDLLYRNNHHLYELLGDERKFHLDVEFPDMGNEQNREIQKRIFNLLVHGFRKINVPLEHGQINMTKTTGKGETGTFKGINKMSYHLIVNNNYYFKTVEDINTFTLFLYEIAKSQSKYDILETELGFAIDMKIYTKNRLFKLPYQSKAGSSRVHIPYNKKQHNLDVAYWLVGNYNNDEDDIKYYDTSSIKLEGLGMEKTIVGRDGRKYTGTTWKMDILREYLTYLPKNKRIDIPVKTLEDVVNSIYNGVEITSYRIFLGVGMAIHRVCQGNDKGLKLWKQWVDKYKSTPLSELDTLYSRFNDKRGYGYTTLKMLASQCNPKVNTHDFTHELFEYDTDMETKTFNHRYISDNEEPIYDFDKYDTIYLKSPMGTGKSYALHQVFQQTDKYKTILYLSSRRAFACSMASEFHNKGFMNYLDGGFTGYEPRIIVSPESLFKIKTNTYDLIVVDESESILKILSSPTLQNPNFKTNIDTFKAIISKADKVIVMDAYLQQRSIEAITSFRPIDNSILWINQYQQEAKELINYDSRETFIDELKDKLKEGKKCVLVCGNRELGKQIAYDLQGEYKYQFYNRDNKLPNTADVNELWDGLDLLLYTPTITCGISFTKLHYDELFMCISNVGSCIPRDLIQASRRVRQFKSNIVHFFLANNTIGLSDDIMPMEKDVITNRIIEIRHAIFEGDSDFFESDDWLIKCHVNNLLEEHISRRQAPLLFKKLFDSENIVGFETNWSAPSNKLSCQTATVYNEIEEIDRQQYLDLIHKNVKEGLTMAEQNQSFKYVVDKYIMPVYRESTYDIYSSGLDYEIKENRIKFHNMVREHTKEPENIAQDVKHVEFEKMTRKQLQYLRTLKKTLGISEYYDESINTNTLLKLQDLLNKDDYIQQLRLAFNAKINIQKVSKAVQVKSILNNIFQEWNGYKLVSDGRKTVRLDNGKFSKLTTYKFEKTLDYRLFIPNLDISDI